MPKRDQHDHTTGDPRTPYAGDGGPDARHAKTHDVRREELTNPKGPQRPDEDFASDLATDDGFQGGSHIDDSLFASADKDLQRRRPDLSADELQRLAIVAPGTQLEQGSVYFDLDDPERGPFKALAGHEARANNRYVAKRDTDYELWNRLVGQDERVEVERPAEKR